MKTSQVYNVFLKVSCLISIAFCVVLMIPNIIQVAWEESNAASWNHYIPTMVLITILTIVISCVLYRYSKFLSEKFDRLNKLALFSSTAIISTIISPYIPNYEIIEIIIGLIMIPSVIITALIIPFKLTLWSAKRYKNSWIIGISPFVFGLTSFCIFALFASIAFRNQGGSGGAALIILIGGVVLTLISTTINVVYMLFR